MGGALGSELAEECQTPLRDIRTTAREHELGAPLAARRGRDPPAAGQRPLRRLQGHLPAVGGRLLRRAALSRVRRQAPRARRQRQLRQVARHGQLVARRAARARDRRQRQVGGRLHRHRHLRPAARAQVQLLGRQGVQAPVGSWIPSPPPFPSPYAAAAQRLTRSVHGRIMVMANASKPFNNGLTANEFLAQLLQSASTPASPDDVAALRASILDSSPRESSSDDSRSSSVELPTDAKEEYQEPVVETRSRRVYSTDLAVKCTTCGGEIPLNDIDSHSKRCVVRSPGTVTWRKYDCKFGRPGESLGFSLTKTKGGFAEITRVTPGGEADKAGVLVGSYIVGLNEHRLSEFEDIVTLVSSLERPIHFHFVHRTLLGSSLSGTSGFGASQRLSGVLSSISSVPEPVTVETEVVFDHNVREIGCVLQVQNGRCIVTAVDDGSAAQKQGVLVGSCISAVNGRHVLRGNEAINMIQKSARPLRIKFHRVEGLMRGWKSS